MPDWFVNFKVDHLNYCKQFPEESSNTHESFVSETAYNGVEELWESITLEEDEIDRSLRAAPLKLTGVKIDKVCANCSEKLPEKGAGSRKCLNCGEQWKGKQEGVVQAKTNTNEIKVMRRLNFSGHLLNQIVS